MHLLGLVALLLQEHTELIVTLISYSNKKIAIKTF